MSAREIIARTAGLMGLQPAMVRVPLLSPGLSSYWISWVTRADRHISRQLVEGLRTNLVAADDGYWMVMRDHVRVPFDEAARRALVAEARALPLHTRFTEWVLHRMTPSVEKRGPSGATS
jgi:hypothetical protein